MRCAGAGSFRGLPAHARVTLAHRLVGVAYGSDFNFDYCVSFTPEQFAESEAYYDYEVWPITVSNASGISVFYKNGRGEVFQTRSCYLRALTFQWRPPFLDLVPKTAMRRALDLDGADAPAPSVLKQFEDAPSCGSISRPRPQRGRWRQELGEHRRHSPQMWFARLCDVGPIHWTALRPFP
jgi:hypothetical protein